MLLFLERRWLVQNAKVHKKCSPVSRCSEGPALGTDAVTALCLWSQTRKMKINLGWYRELRPYLHCR